MPKPASSSALRHAAIAGAAMLALAIVLQTLDIRPRRPFTSGLHSATLGLQLMRDVRELPDIVVFQARDERQPTDHRGAIQRALTIDYFFIAAYASFFALMGRALISTGGRRRIVVGRFAIVAAVAGALFDVLENRATSALLQGGMATLPRVFSVPKWALVFVAVGATAPLLIDRTTSSLRRWVGYVACVVSVFAAMEAVYGIAADHETLIEVANGRLALALLLTEFFLWTPNVLANGVQAALDRAAARPLLRKIAGWPATDPDETVGDPIVEPTQSYF
jgi:hypothetical protein